MIQRASRLFVLSLTVYLLPAAFAANLTVSTYLRDGFTPTAIASDPGGNIYIAGSTIVDPASRATSAAVMKVNPTATDYVYFSYIDATAPDQVTAIAVDASGNAYVAGWTTNPNFPVTGATLGTAPAGANDPRSFVTKLDSRGFVVFSVLIGGPASSRALGITLTPQGQILVSGIALSKGFPSTAGAYSVPDSTNQWFLLELDNVGSKVLFSATGIGGSSLALDAAGNIYMAGSSTNANYPTTPGAFQTTLTPGLYCFGLCQISFTGNVQHVTKTDPAATRLIYSTGLNDPNGLGGSTTNTGLAVDAAGNAYVTGTLLQGRYPFTVPDSSGATSYLTKVDPGGAHLLFSIPAGGGGVQLDSSGDVYVAGAVTSIVSAGFLGLPGPAPIVFVPPPLASIPPVCRPNFLTAVSSPYSMKVDPNSGAVIDAQWIDAAAASATAVTLASGKLFLTGPTEGPQVPESPGALTTEGLGPGFIAGAYLGAVDFNAAAAGPSIACVRDAGNLSHTGAVASFQLLSIFGANLGPVTGVAATGGSQTSLGGVSVTFDGIPAPLLYVSASQINVAVPPPPLPPANVQKSTTVMELTYNGGTVRRQFPFTMSNLNLFADLSAMESGCAGAGVTDNAFQPLALNADGTRNSCTNPAKAGSTVSLFVHGPGGFGIPAPRLTNLHANFAFGCTALVTDAALISEFVYKVDVIVPTSLAFCNQAFDRAEAVSMTLSYNDEPVGPFAVPVNAGGLNLTFSPPGAPVRMFIWITP